MRYLLKFLFIPFFLIFINTSLSYGNFCNKSIQTYKNYVKGGGALVGLFAGPPALLAFVAPASSLIILNAVVVGLVGAAIPLSFESRDTSASLKKDNIQGILPLTLGYSYVFPSGFTLGTHVFYLPPVDYIKANYHREKGLKNLTIQSLGITLGYSW